MCFNPQLIFYPTRASLWSYSSHCIVFRCTFWCITPPTWRAVSLSTPFVVRWWARQIVKNIPPSDMLEVRSKVAALTALSGERKDWGVSRPWERDYLANVRNTHEQKHKTWTELTIAKLDSSKLVKISHLYLVFLLKINKSCVFSLFFSPPSISGSLFFFFFF